MLGCTGQVIEANGVYAELRECWMLAENRRVSCAAPNWTDQPTIHALVVEVIKVDEELRGRGLCRQFLESLCEDDRFDLIVVECVGNPILADALRRWGWEEDEGVSDFYWEMGAPIPVPKSLNFSHATGDSCNGKRSPE